MSNNIDLQKIADELEFDLEDVEMLLEVFIESADESLELLQNGIQNNDYDTIFKAAHAIKGSAANLTLDDISQVAKTLESEARNSTDFNYQGSFDQLNLLINNLK